LGKKAPKPRDGRPWAFVALDLYTHFNNWHHGMSEKLSPDLREKMRTIVLATLAGLFVVNAIQAQAPQIPVKSGNPLPNIPALPPLPLPPATPAELPPPSTVFGSDLPPSGEIVPPPVVRPPAPVPGAPIEVPPGPQFWGTFDYLMWRSKGALAPATVGMVLGGAARATPINPLAAFEVNDNRINGDLQNGFRLDVGCWLDKPNGTGVELKYTQFIHAERTSTYFGSPVTALVRPFWNEASNSPSLFQLSAPDGSLLGNARVRTSYDSDGFEGNYLWRGSPMFSEEAHWIVGMRYWGLKENMTVEAGSEAGGMNVGTFDSFTTRNRFFGPQVGADLNWSRSGFTFDVAFKLAVGAMMEQATIQGSTTAVLPSGSVFERQGGFLALSTNSGTHDRTKLAFMRDTSFSVSYSLTENIALHIGYDILWVSNVVRPGEQASLNINPTLLPFSAMPTLPLQPGFRFNEETFWMHGFTVGLAVQF
jgi:Putative beta barrel porin-7 (BBP7)